MQMQGIGGQRPDICQREEKEEFNRVKQDICKKCKYWKGIEEEKKKIKNADQEWVLQYNGRSSELETGLCLVLHE